ncbi:SigE family RNA polymerase sigma factor [Streptomyces sparsogenes]|uniref:SigE family RNA polymerase sigma factor n=1 Tax=Streptomyces sparsogenes TaxID=67365 RepID=UPI0033E200D4
MGDTTADRDEEFREFVAARWPRLLRTAYLLCGEQHAAEDLVQSALVRVYVAWRRVRAADEPDAYVRRVLVNEHARRHRRKLKEFLTLSQDHTDGRQTPDRDRITLADDREMLRHALAGLPPRQRQAVVLRYWEDLSESQDLRKQRSAAPAKERLKDRAGTSGRAMPDVTALTRPRGGRR